MGRARGRSFRDDLEGAPKNLCEVRDLCHTRPHGEDAGNRDDGVERLGEGLLERLGDVVDVVGDAREHVAARAAVDVGQGHAGKLVLDLGAHAPAGALDDARQDPPLDPQEDCGGEVEGENLQEDDHEGAGVEPAADDDVVGGEHVGVAVLAAGAQRLGELVAGQAVGQAARAQERAEDALEDDVRGAGEHLGGDDVEDDRHDGEDDDGGNAPPLGAQLAEEPLPG